MPSPFLEDRKKVWALSVPEPLPPEPPAPPSLPGRMWEGIKEGVTAVLPPVLERIGEQQGRAIQAKERAAQEIVEPTVRAGGRLLEQLPLVLDPTGQAVKSLGHSYLEALRESATTPYTPPTFELPSFPRITKPAIPSLPPLTGQIMGRLPNGRPIVRAKDGSVSTVRMIQSEIDGKTYNIPTLFGGQEVGPDEAIRRVREAGMIDPDTGEPLIGYATLEEAEAARQQEHETHEAYARSLTTQPPPQPIPELSTEMPAMRPTAPEQPGLISRLLTPIGEAAKSLGESYMAPLREAATTPRPPTAMPELPSVRSLIERIGEQQGKVVQAQERTAKEIVEPTAREAWQALEKLGPQIQVRTKMPAEELYGDEDPPDAVKDAPPPQLTRGYLTSAIRDIVSGLYAASAGMIRSPAWIEQLISGKETVVGRTASEIADDLDKAVKVIAPDDPRFFDKFFSALGSTGTFVFPGLLTQGVALKLVPHFPRLARAGAAGTSAGVEAAVEGSETFDTLVKQGMDKQQAARQAGKVFAENMVLLPITNYFGLFGNHRQYMVRLLSSMSMEGAQEFLQDVSQQYHTLGPDKFMNWWQSLEAGAIGALVGGAFKFTSRAPKEQPKPGDYGMSDGLPFTDRDSAKSSMLQIDWMDPMQHEVVEVEGGWAIRSKPLTPTETSVPPQEGDVLSADNRPFATEHNARFALEHRRDVSPETHEAVEVGERAWVMRPKTTPVTEAPAVSGLPPLPERSGLPPLPERSGLPPLPETSGLPQLPERSGLPPLPERSGLPPLDLGRPPDVETPPEHPPPVVSPPPTPTSAPPTQAPVVFLGWQEFPASSNRPPVAMWNLTEDIPGHPKGSTLTTKTLRDAGYQLEEPEPPQPTQATPTEPPTGQAEGERVGAGTKDLQSFIAEARRLSDEVGDTDQMNTSALIDAFRRAKGDVIAASQLYFGMKDDAAPSIARNLKEFKEKTAKLASLYDQQYNLQPKGSPPAETPAQPEVSAPTEPALPVSITLQQQKEIDRIVRQARYDLSRKKLLTNHVRVYQSPEGDLYIGIPVGGGLTLQRLTPEGRLGGLANNMMANEWPVVHEVQLTATEPSTEPSVTPPTLPAAEGTASEPSTAPTQPTATVTVNTQRGGVEIKFHEKPTSETTARLKAAGFKWSGRQGLWYAKHTPSRETFARKIAGETPAGPETPPTMPTPTERPVDEIDGPVFKEGDRVQWTDSQGNILTGTVRSHRAGEVSIKTDQKVSLGGVPIGRVDQVRPERLTKLESPTPPPTPPEGVSAFSATGKIPPPSQTEARERAEFWLSQIEASLANIDSNKKSAHDARVLYQGPPIAQRLVNFAVEANSEQWQADYPFIHQLTNDTLTQSITDPTGTSINWDTVRQMADHYRPYIEKMRRELGGISTPPKPTPPRLPEPTTGIPPTSLEAQVRDLDGQISDLSRDIGSVHDNITRLLQNRNQAVRDGQSSAATSLTERLADEQVRLSQMQDKLRTLEATHAQLAGQLLQSGGREVNLPEATAPTPSPIEQEATSLSDDDLDDLLDEEIAAYQERQGEAPTKTPEASLRHEAIAEELQQYEKVGAWIRQAVEEAKASGKAEMSGHGPLKAVSERIRAGDVPADIKRLMEKFFDPTIDREIGERLYWDHPDYPRTGTLMDFMDAWDGLRAEANDVGAIDEQLRQQQRSSTTPSESPPEQSETTQDVVTPEPMPSPSPTDILAQASAEAKAGFAEGVKGLQALFGALKKSEQGELGGTSDELYGQALPHFRQSWQHFKAAGGSVRDFVRAIVEQVGPDVRPYLKRFIQSPTDWGEGIPDEQPSAADDQTRGLGETGPGTLEDTSTQDVPGPGERGEAPAESETSGADDQGGDGGTDLTGGEPRDGMGAAEGGMAPPAGGRGRSGGRGRRGPRDRAHQPGERADPDRGNYRLTPDDALEGRSVEQQFDDNLAAIELLQTLEAEGRKATPEEQAVLVKYIGWGGLSQAFFSHHEYPLRLLQEAHEKGGELSYADRNSLDISIRNRAWSPRAIKLLDLVSTGVLTEEQYKSMRASTTNANYTSPTVIDAIWSAVQRMGFTGGRVLEPGMGVGHFFGRRPQGMKLKLSGVELDSISARIAKHLYQSANIIEGGFESRQAPSAQNFFDLVIGNVPFGQERPYDPVYNPKRHLSLHNFFIEKALGLTRPGGMVAVITSRYTLDAENARTRAAWEGKADFVGSIRLPSSTFEDFSGTSVTSDIIFLRKRDVNETPQSQPWLEARLTELPVQRNTMLYGERPEAHINEYFLAHPEQMLGTLVWGRGTRPGGDAQLLSEGRDLASDLTEAIQRLPEQIIKPPAHQPTEAPSSDVFVPGPETIKPNAFAIVKGKVAQRVGDLRDEAGNIQAKMAIVNESPKVLERIKGMIGIRDALRTVLNLQVADGTDEQIQSAQAELSRLYDAFVSEHGPLHDSANYKAFADDPDIGPLLALEHYDRITKTATKSDIFTERTLQRFQPATHADTAQDALVITLGERGKVDLAHMTQLTGHGVEDIQAELRGIIFEDPDGAGWQTAEEYLSGDVREKLRHAQDAEAADPGRYQANLEALEAAQPEKISYYVMPDGKASIEVPMGSMVIQPSDLDAFVHQFFGDPKEYGGKPIQIVKVQYSPETSRWDVAYVDKRTKDRYQDDVANTTTWGTGTFDMTDLVERILNHGSLQVRMPHPTEEGKTVLDPVETAKAEAKAFEIQQAWKDWLWADEARKTRLEEDYNNHFNSIRLRTYDGSHLKLPGMNPSIFEHLYTHQRNGIWRGITAPNTLLAWVVGAGKTRAAAAIVMEKKRLGLSRKSMIVVPNHLLEQWAKEFSEAYPASNVLVADEHNFSAKKRQEFMGRIATGNWDAVIVKQSSLELLPVRLETQEAFIEEQLDEILPALEDLRATQGKRSFTVKELEKVVKNLQQKLAQIAAQKGKDQGVTWEDTGIDSLIVDESHEYKNLWYLSKMSGIQGMGSAEGADKTADLFTKIRYLHSVNNGSGVVFMTGTPLSNTMGEMHHFLRYLGPNIIRQMNLGTFDAWADTFGQVTEQTVVNSTGTGYTRERAFRSFINIPELMQLWRQVADIRTHKNLEQDGILLPGQNLPLIRSYGMPFEPLSEQEAEERARKEEPKWQIMSVESSPELQLYMKELIQRMEDYRNPATRDDHDNPLNITTDAKKAAIDLRLIDPRLPVDKTGKLYRMTHNIAKIWEATQDRKATQLVFSDLGTPAAKGSKKKGAFNLYQTIKDELQEHGIPVHEIAFIHDSTKAEDKQKLFDAVNRGEIRILIGSTQKMGAGTNVQRKLIAVHHLDVPWRPSDLEQRNGRINRPGNENSEIVIFNYVTKNSFDSRLWQKIESKARNFEQINSGDPNLRHGEDFAGRSIISSAAEAKAEATNDPRIIERVDLETKVGRLSALRTGYYQGQQRMKELIRRLPQDIDVTEFQLEKAQADEAFVKEHAPADDVSSMTVLGQPYTKSTEAGAALLQAIEATSKPYLAGQPKHRQIGSDYSKPTFIPLGEIAGLAIQIKMRPSKWSNYGVLVDAELVFPSEEVFEIADSKDPAGIMTSLRAGLNNPTQRIFRLTQSLESIRKQLTDFQEELGKPFKYEEEYRKASERLAQLESDLDPDADRPDTQFSAPPAESTEKPIVKRTPTETERKTAQAVMTMLQQIDAPEGQDQLDTEQSRSIIMGLWNAGEDFSSTEGVLNKALAKVNEYFENLKTIIDDETGAIRLPSWQLSALKPAIMSAMHNIGKSTAINTAMGTRPQLFALYDQAPQFYKVVARKIAARDSAQVVALQHFQSLTRILSRESQQEFFAKFLLSEQAKGIKMDPTRAADVTIPELTGAEETAFYGDPTMQEALHYWLTQVQPMVERLSGPAGVKSRRETPSGAYVMLHAVKPDDPHAPKIIFHGVPDEGPQGFAPGSSPSTGSIPLRFRRTTSKSAKQATGAGAHYSGDIKDLLEHMFLDRYTTANQNFLVNAVKAYRVKKDPETGKIPEEVTFAGERVPVVRATIRTRTRIIDANGVEHWVSENIPVPKPIDDAYKLATLPQEATYIPLLTPFLNVSTSIMLASPAEATMHSFNVLSALMNAPGVGNSLGRTGRLLSAVGAPGRLATIMADVMNIYGEEAEADLRTLAEYGGLRTRMFGDSETGLQALPVLKQLKESVFDYPGSKRGFWGLESRARVAMLRAVRHANPGIADADAVRLINNQLGTYVGTMAPTLVKFLRGIGLDPFAAAGVALIKTGTKGFVGMGPQGFSWEIAAVNWVSIPLTVYLLNKWLDPDDRDPWDIPGLKIGGVRIWGDDEKTIDVDFRYIAQSAARGARFLGISQVLDKIKNGDSAPGELAKTWLQAMGQNVLNRFGPGPRLLWGMSFGSVPYMTETGPMKQGDISVTDPIGARVRTEISHWVPGGEIWTALGEKAGLLTPDAVQHGVAWHIGNLFGVKLSERGPERELIGQPIRAKRGRVSEAAQDIAFKATRLPPEERLPYIQRRIAQDVPKEMQAEAYAWAIRSYRSRLRSVGRSYGMAVSPPMLEPAVND